MRGAKSHGGGEPPRPAAKPVLSTFLLHHLPFNLSTTTPCSALIFLLLKTSFPPPTPPKFSSRACGAPLLLLEMPSRLASQSHLTPKSKFYSHACGVHPPLPLPLFSSSALPISHPSTQLANAYFSPASLQFSMILRRFLSKNIYASIAPRPSPHFHIFAPAARANPPPSTRNGAAAPTLSTAPHQTQHAFETGNSPRPKFLRAPAARGRAPIH